MHAAVRVALGALIIATLGTPTSHGAGGTSKVAAKGRPVPRIDHWLPGIAEVLAHPARGDGWNSRFTEWPNDVNQYEFHVTGTEQLNEVIALFARIRVGKADAADGDSPEEVRIAQPIRLQPPAEPEIRLCPTAEPAGFGWVSEFEAENRIPAVFTIGDQHRIDQWYQQFIAPRGNQFGVMIFADVPVAVPPTLTIFVGHEAVRLDELEIPSGVKVSMGYLPRMWHEANLVDTTPEMPQEEEKADEKPSVVVPVPEGAEAERVEAAMDAIRAYLAEREAANPRDKGE